MVRTAALQQHDGGRRDDQAGDQYKRREPPCADLAGGRFLVLGEAQIVHEQRGVFRVRVSGRVGQAAVRADDLAVRGPPAPGARVYEPLPPLTRSLPGLGITLACYEAGR